MKRLLPVIICALAFSVSSLAQTAETFDIATFQPPNGWQKQTKDGVIIFSTSNQQNGSYAVITIYRSGDSSGNVKSDFEADWQEFILGQLGIKSKPQLEPTTNVEGWEFIAGAAAFENETGKAAVILGTYSGYGRKVSSAAVFNSKDSLPAIEAFIGSIKLTKPEARSQSAASNSESDTSILGTWGVSASNQSSYAVSNGISGYIKRQYTFNADGTYVFLSKNFQMTSDKILLVRQSGTYQVSGNTLTISPNTSVIEAWSKNRGIDDWGKRLNSQPHPLEKVTYQFTKHYFSGIQTWSLVLQSGTPTQRDGPFSGGTTFDNAWIYSPPCDQCFIKQPN
jgi:hypothetical protein